MTFIRTALISLHLNPVIPHQPSNNLSPTTVTLQTQYNTFVHKNIHTQLIGTLLTAPCRVVVVYLAAFCDALFCTYVCSLPIVFFAFSTKFQPFSPSLSSRNHLLSNAWCVLPFDRSRLIDTAKANIDHLITFIFNLISRLE